MCSERVCNGVTDYGWKGSGIVWGKGKVGLIKYAWMISKYEKLRMTERKGSFLGGSEYIF